MYTAFYGLREKPFSLTPDPKFLFLAESHREALAHLLYGLEQGEGFIVVSGEVGTGKTTICRTLLERLGAETELAFLFNPSGSADEMLQSVNEEYGLPASGLSRRELLSQLNRFLLEKNRESKRVVLIIDEAQNLSTTTLEQVRLLSNLETTSSKLIQIILLGQPELAEKLDSDELRQLRQRIGVRWQLTPLSLSETAQYVRHRLRVAAGADRAALFDDAALAEVHRRTSGVPRLVNVLCDRALLAGYAAETAQVGAAHVKQAAGEIRDLQGGAIGDARPRRRRRGFGPALATVATALALVAGIWLGRGEAGLVLRDWLDDPTPLLPTVSARASGPGPTRPVASVASGVDVTRDVRSEAPASIEGAGSVAPVALTEAESQTAPVVLTEAEGRTEPVVVIEEDAWGEPVELVEADAWGESALADPPGGAATMQALASIVEPVHAPADGVPGDAFLTHLLREVSPSTSRDLAVAEILHAWGRADRIGPGGSEALALARLRDAGLAIHTIVAPDLDELARLDRPALIEVRDGDGEIRWLALVELRSSVAFLGGVVDRGPIGVARSTVEAGFEGRAHVVWSPGVDLEGAPVLRSGSEGPPVQWLQSALAELGYMPTAAPGASLQRGIDAPAVYDAATRRGVERFQQARGLRQDGITGPITLMQLDDALGHRDRPRLNVADDPGGRGGAG